ncbi:hypothetical protein M407DRAFT_242406, partial [Tulasnella calospora MUT 4182]
MPGSETRGTNNWQINSLTRYVRPKPQASFALYETSSYWQFSDKPVSPGTTGKGTLEGRVLRCPDEQRDQRPDVLPGQVIVPRHVPDFRRNSNRSQKTEVRGIMS